MSHTLNINEMENRMVAVSQKCLLTVHYKEDAQATLNKTRPVIYNTNHSI